MAEDKKRRYAFFVTPHGYGHAARAAAVMSAIREAQPGTLFEIYTRVPRWFFNMTLGSGFTYHEVLTDIGLAQSTAMEENLPETIQRLDDFLPFRAEHVQALACQVKEKDCEIVFCDVAPLGIAVANAAGLPSVLVENFTWDWIYEGYVEQEPRFAPHIAFLRETFAAAGHHIRTEPACTYDPPADLLTGVVSRKPQHSRAETRARLGVSAATPLVMITMGGILTAYPFLGRLERPDGALKDVRFLIPGGSEAYDQRGSLVLIPHHSDLYHPDLVEASDVIIGKLGYSTLAEAYTSGTTFTFIPRMRFRESVPMGRFAREQMSAVELEEDRFFSGEWLDLVPGLLARPRNKPAVPNGADLIAEYIRRLAIS